MPKKILLAGGVIIVLILSGISFGYGYWLGTKEKVREVPRILGLETSAVIKSQHANLEGEIVEITNRTLTLVANGDTLAVPIGEEARVMAFVLVNETEEGPRFEHKEKEFKDIKVGDKVEVLVNLKPDGDFVGVHVVIWPEERI